MRGGGDTNTRGERQCNPKIGTGDTPTPNQQSFSHVSLIFWYTTRTYTLTFILFM